MSLFSYIQVEVASKTHMFDGSVLLDSSQREWLGPLVLKWAESRRQQASLWSLSNYQWNKCLRDAVKSLGLPWKVSAYVLRHTGPSQDVLSRDRTLEQVKRRGRWSSDQTVRRYEKSSRVLARLKDLRRDLLQHIEWCNQNIGAVLGGATAARAAPVVLRQIQKQLKKKVKS
jgi:hypothetical protein